MIAGAGFLSIALGALIGIGREPTGFLYNSSAALCIGGIIIILVSLFATAVVSGRRYVPKTDAERAWHALPYWKRYARYLQWVALLSIIGGVISAASWDAASEKIIVTAATYGILGGTIIGVLWLAGAIRRRVRAISYRPEQADASEKPASSRDP